MSNSCGCVHRKHFELPGRGPQSTDYLDTSNCRLSEIEQENAELRRRLEEETAIVDSVWKALGKSTYKECKPYSIDEWISKLRRRAEAAEHNFAVEHDALVTAEMQRAELRRRLEESEAHCYDVESGEVYLQLKALRDALAAALRTYGRHCVGCSMARKISPGQCDCGFIVATLTLTGIPAPPSKLKLPNLSRGFEVHVPPREVKNG